MLLKNASFVKSGIEKCQLVTVHPTNSAPLINFRLSSDPEILLIKHRPSTQIGTETCKNVYATCNIFRLSFHLCMPNLSRGTAILGILSPSHLLSAHLFQTANLGVSRVISHFASFSFPPPPPSSLLPKRPLCFLYPSTSFFFLLLLLLSSWRPEILFLGDETGAAQNTLSFLISF